MFFFEDFNVHHKDWRTYSGGTDRSGELCYNFSVSNDLTQIVNVFTRIIGCDSHSPALLDLSIFSEDSICLKCLLKELKPKFFQSKTLRISQYLTGCNLNLKKVIRF